MKSILVSIRNRIHMEIVNMVVVVKLQNHLDLNELHDRLDNTEFNAGHTWLKMRIKPEDNYIAFYKSGKFLITGIKSVEKTEKLIKKVSSLLTNSGIENPVDKYDVTNIVLTEKINLDISLEDLIFKLDTKKSYYEPEQFPGLFYKTQGISFTIFSSGKIIITGVKDINQAEIVFEELKETIQQ